MQSYGAVKGGQQSTLGANSGRDACTEKVKTRKNVDSEVDCKFSVRTHERRKGKCKACGKRCEKCEKEMTLL